MITMNSINLKQIMQ